jgi:hypothetical protein
MPNALPVNISACAYQATQIPLALDKTLDIIWLKMTELAQPSGNHSHHLLYYFDLRFVNFVVFGLRGGRKILFRFVANFKCVLFFSGCDL